MSWGPLPLPQKALRTPSLFQQPRLSEPYSTRSPKQQEFRENEENGYEGLDTIGRLQTWLVFLINF